MFKFALRNVLRNKKRSILTIITVFFGAYVSSFSIGWMNGLIDSFFIDGFVKYRTAHIRVVTEGFNDREKFMPVDEIIYGSDDLVNRIRAIDGVKSVEERIRFGILLGKADNTVESIGMGLDLKNNRFNLGEKLIDGEIAESGIYIGVELADKLDAAVGESLLIATKTSEGGLNGIKLPIKGIFQFNVGLLDRKFFYIGLADAKKLLKIRDGTTEIFIYNEDVDSVLNVQEEINKILPAGVISLNFMEQIGPLYSLLKIQKVMLYFFAALILFLASFVIINTMMMAIFERAREIGALKAMGMTDRQLFTNFTIEGAIIGAIGGILGSIAAFILISIMSRVGLNFSQAFGATDYPMEYILRPQLDFYVIVIGTLISIIIPAIAAMVPANYVKKLTAAEALRK